MALSTDLPVRRQKAVPLGSAGTGTVVPSTSSRSRQIQALRAVAVLSVVGFHIWPQYLRGGYVGVDVFFVISGYLITGHLVREIDRTGTVRLRDFWARRIRRLLPAAFLVLAVALVLTVAVVPQVQWPQEFAEIRASALYVENWRLALDSTDYLAAHNAPSLVQHYWSLSVEEQYYVVWPLLLIVASRFVRRRRVVIGVLTALLVVSFAYCVLLTVSGDPSSYFSTGTRAWEFALGGLLAAVPSIRPLSGPRARAAFGLVGFVLVIAVDLLYTRSTVFPGYAAALPAIGAGLVVRAGDSDVPWASDRIGRLRVVQWLGSWSYSIYLWHWPLVIVVPLLAQRGIGIDSGLVVLAVSVLLGALSKRFIEDPFRTSTRFGRRSRTALLFMVTGVLILAVVSSVLDRLEVQAVAKVAVRTSAQLATKTSCVGAAALVNHCPSPFAQTATVQPVVAANDVPWNLGVAAAAPCHGESVTSSPTPHACTFGVLSGAVETVALVGDSHADHLIDALDIYALQHHWRLITYTREGCSGITPDPGVSAACTSWSRQVQAQLRKRNDIQVVLFSNYTRNHAFTAATAAATWARLERSGKQVIPIRDVPGMAPGVQDPTCVSEHPHVVDPCTTTETTSDLMTRAAAKAKLPIVDLQNLFCSSGRCHAVIGGLIVYMDDDHLTLSYDRTLAPYLGARVAALIRSRAR